MEELASLSGGDGYGLQRREPCGDEVFKLAVFGEARDAAGDGAGVGAEGDLDSGVVEGFEVLASYGVVVLGLGGLRSG